MLYSNSDLVKTHQQIDRQEQSYTDCDMAFTNNRDYKCSDCHMAFAQSFHLKRHQRRKELVSV